MEDFGFPPVFPAEVEGEQPVAQQQDTDVIKDKAKGKKVPCQV